jgi:hypothetical protein
MYTVLSVRCYKFITRFIVESKNFVHLKQITRTIFDNTFHFDQIFFGTKQGNPLITFKTEIM